MRRSVEAAADAAAGVEYIQPRRSWPRPATPCDLTPAWAGEFITFNDWVNFATQRLTGTGDKYGSIPSVCIDSIGRRCSIGAHFSRARDEGTFPVRFFWDMRPSEVSALPVDVGGGGDLGPVVGEADASSALPRRTIGAAMPSEGGE